MSITHLDLIILCKKITFVLSYSEIGDEDTKRPARMQNINSEIVMPKEQLFDMFQQILSIKKFEHQLLYNALQVGS